MSEVPLYKTPRNPADSRRAGRRTTVGEELNGEL